MATTLIDAGPLSFSQELLFLGTRHQSPQPVIAEVVSLEGDLPVEDVSLGLTAISSSYDALRTSFSIRDKRCIAEVYSHGAQPYPELIEGERESPTAIGEQIGSTLETVSPFAGQTLASLLIRRGPRRHLWLLAFHHLVSDGWSQHLYGQSFSKAVRGEVPSAVQPSTLAYARHQLAWLTTSEAQAQLDWWIRRLNTMPRTGVYPLPVSRTVTPAWRAQIWVGRHLRTAVLSAATLYRSPLLAVLFAALVRTITRRVEREWIAVQSMVSGRTLPNGHGTVGAFYNSVILDAPGRSDIPARELLHHVRKSVFEALRNQEVPAALLSRALVKKGMPDLSTLAPMTFNVIRHPLSEFKLAGIRMRQTDLTTLEPIETETEEVKIHVTPRAQTGSPLTMVVSILKEELFVFLDGSGEPQVHQGAGFIQAYRDELHYFCLELGIKVGHGKQNVAGLI